MNFYTSDNHFFHRNIIRLSERPFSDMEEMHTTMISKWNNRVSNKDTVYILGDFSFGGGKETNGILEQLNGKKVLIKGNHDNYLSDKLFNYNLFESIHPYMEIKDLNKIVVLFHFPILEWKGFYKGGIHLYGHVHNKAMRYDLLPNPSHNALHVGVDTNDFEPKTLSELITKVNLN